MLTIENFKEQVEKQVICKLSNNGDYEARYESKTSHLTFVPIFKNVKALPAFRLGDLYQIQTLSVSPSHSLPFLLSLRQSTS